MPTYRNTLKTGTNELQFWVGYGRYFNIYNNIVVTNHKITFPTIFQLRNEIMDHTSALSTMSKHCFAKTNNCENSLVKPRKKTKQSRQLPNGKHSDSNVALQLHTSCSEERLTRSSNIKNRVSQHHSTNNQSENSLNYSVDNRNSTSTTVAAVRALIAQSKKARKSKEERQKRGEYNSYTPEIREAIAVHALRHGTHSAARTFSASLGNSSFKEIISKN